MPNSDTIDDIKIRTAAIRSNEVRLSEFGFQVVTMPWAEVHSSLMLGTIDATAGQTADEAYNWRDAIKYHYRANDLFSTTWLIMDLGLFDSLPQEDQDILTDTAAEFVPWVWNLFKTGNEELLDGLRDSGVEVIELTDEQLRALAEVSRDVEWSALEDVVGKELIDKFRQHAPPIP